MLGDRQREKKPRNGASDVGLGGIGGNDHAVIIPDVIPGPSTATEKI